MSCNLLPSFQLRLVSMFDLGSDEAPEVEGEAHRQAERVAFYRCAATLTCCISTAVLSMRAC